MKIGDVDHGIDIDKARKILNISQITAEKCRNCWALVHCSICAKGLDENGIFSAARKETLCGKCKSRVINLLKECILIKEARNVYKV